MIGGMDDMNGLRRREIKKLNRSETTIQRELKEVRILFPIVV
jgi:hypothetical protein